MDRNFVATRVAFETLGCKLNQAESESLARDLEAAGFCLVAPDESCDVYVLNACTVTATADAKARQLLRLAHRRRANSVLVAAGCYGESVAGALRAVTGTQVLLCRDKAEVVPKLRQLGYGGRCVRNHTRRRTRAFVKAQDGCSSFCTYCIVPFIRGREKSRPPDDVVNEVSARVGESYQEVVLTGTEIGAYRHQGLDLAGLLGRILKETGVARLRLSSLQPTEITPALLKFWGDHRLCPHFHMSLQSGSDSVLRRMGRHYNAAEYLAAAGRIRDAVPDAAITTDIIVGFPGETEAEFEESYCLCASLGFARIHVFSFSPRPGTAAAAMPAQVATGIKKERSQRMLVLAKESAKAYRSLFLGRTLAVLWETEASGILTGYTGNYIRIFADAGQGLPNTILAVRLIKLYKDGVWGEIQKEVI